MVEVWYAQFKEIHMTDAALRKELDRELSHIQVLLDKVNKLFQERAELKLETTENESKILNKVRKWAQLIKDCHILLRDK